MGLGKTLITLTALSALIRFDYSQHHVLVIAPKKVAQATWQAEAAKWDHTKDLTFSSLLGGKKGRSEGLKQDADIYIINRDTVSDLVKELQNDWFFDMVVIDESSSFKSPKAKRFKALKSIRKRIDRMVELTGTPAPKNMEDIWSQIYLLDSGARLGKTITGYRNTYFVPDKRNGSTIFSYKLKPEAEPAIREKISDLCVSMKAEDYIQLPEIVFEDVPVVLDPTAMAKYRFFEKQYVLELDNDRVLDAGSAAVLRGKLLQLSSGNVYDVDGETQNIHSCKYEALEELMESLENEPVLMFYRFKHEIPQLLEIASKLGRKAAILEGNDEVVKWNNHEIDLLLAHPASCAYGLNLQEGGHHIIWYGLTDSLELYQQANARLHRQGQVKPVIVHRLLAEGTVDYDVARSLESKDHSQEALLQAMKDRIDRVLREVA